MLKGEQDFEKNTDEDAAGDKCQQPDWKGTAEFGSDGSWWRRMMRGRRGAKIPELSGT